MMDATGCRFPGKQGNLPLTAFRSLDEQAEGGEILRATDHDRTNQRLIKRYSHGFHRLLTKTWTLYLVSLAVLQSTKRAISRSDDSLCFAYNFSLYYNISNSRS